MMTLLSDKQQTTSGLGEDTDSSVFLFLKKATMSRDLLFRDLLCSFIY